MPPRILPVLILLFAATVRADNAPSYARQIRPLLTKYCSECHNAKAQKGGLDLDTMQAIRAGGDNGPVLVPGKASESKLVVLLEGATKPIMPPMKIAVRPTKAEIAMVRRWVESGAKEDAVVKIAIPDIRPKSKLLSPITGLVSRPDKRHEEFVAARGRTVFAVGDAKARSPEAAEPVTALSVANELASVLFQSGPYAVAIGSPGAPGKVVLTRLASEDFGLGSFSDPIIEHNDTVLDLAIRDNLLASASYDSRVQVVSIRSIQFAATQKTECTFEKVVVLKDHSDAVYGVAFHPSGKILASCSADRTVKLWEIPSGKLLQTLSDANDWLYSVAWSRDGRTIAAGGVDKSLRIYGWNDQEAKLIGSTFAHEGPILKLAFSPDGRALFSLGQDRVVKSWNPASLQELQVFPKLIEDGLTLAVAASGRKIAVGRYDGEVQFFDVEQPKADAKADVDPFPEVQEAGVNDSPAHGQKVPLPARVVGQLDRAGDVDYFRFAVAKGQQLGAEAIVPKGGRLAPVLQLTDARGHVISESDRGFLGHTFAEAGTFALGIRDRELRGGKDFTYTLRLGEIPVVTSAVPFGGQRGKTVAVQVRGVFLNEAQAAVPIPADADVGSKVAVPVTSKLGVPRGLPSLIVGDLPETLAAKSSENRIVVPGTGNGVVGPNDTDRWTFAAKKGQRLVVEVNARRLGSPLDSIIEIHDAKDRLVPRAVLRCLAKTNVTFRDHDSVNNSIRIETWNELATNDLMYLDGELLKIRGLPGHPDADCSFFNVRGRRLTYLDTTPIHHSNNTPLYKVSVHPPGTAFPPNGFPVFEIPYRNDDGGPGFERDSRLFFDPPADGVYHVVVRDIRNLGGPDFAYRLTIRPPEPRFTVSFAPTQLKIPRGGAVSLNLNVERLDGYQGPIDLRFENVPAGLHVPHTRLDSEIWSGVVPMSADADAKIDAKTPPLTLVGSATIDGKTATHTFVGSLPTLQDDSSDLVVWTDTQEISLKPGGEATLTVHIERRKGLKGRVPLDIRGVPHGVRVLDIGLNGILVNEGETERVVTFAAEAWVEPGVRPVAVVARSEARNAEQTAKAVLLRIGK